jgi:hypothetical protein
MTDLVILNGVKWLLEERIFGFSAYTVEYGHQNNNSYDIEASGDPPGAPFLEVLG